MPATSDGSAGAVSVPLDPDRFGPAENTVLGMDGITVSAFRYPGGVAALRLRASRAELIVLPFMGQQIWRASFDGRAATMLSMFEEPVATDRFLETYGAFFIHCGVTGVGAPGPDDTHPLHGELPLARYEDVKLEADPRAGRITISGRYRHRVAFSTNYVATASVTLTVDQAAVDIGIEIENLRDAAMDLLYLGHANFRPVDGSELIYSAHYTPRDVAVRRSVPSHITPPPGYLKTIDQLADNPAMHHAIRPELPCDPELVFSLAMQPDASGRVHALQRHPDGSADVISYDKASLPKAIRWLCRTGDQQGLGLALPSTSGVEGYTAEKAAGRVVHLDPFETWRAAIQVGQLTSKEASERAHEIDKTCGRE